MVFGKSRSGFAKDLREWETGQANSKSTTYMAGEGTGQG